jgi:hypothetical protein
MAVKSSRLGEAMELAEGGRERVATRTMIVPDSFVHAEQRYRCWSSQTNMNPPGGGLLE